MVSAVLIMQLQFSNSETENVGLLMITVFIKRLDFAHFPWNSFFETCILLTMEQDFPPPRLHKVDKTLLQVFSNKS